MTDVSLSTTSAVTPQAGDLIPVVRNGAWVNADGAVLVDAASSATAAANSATSAAQEVEQSLTTISSGVSSAQETADAALGAVQSGGFVTEASLETTLGGYATTSGVTSEIESATSGLVLSGTSGTNIGANPVTYGGQTVSLDTALEQASQTGGDGSGGDVVTLKYGDNFLPRGISTDMDVKAPMAAMTLAGSGPLADLPGAHIIVDPMTLYQEFVGTGGALTASSAYVLMNYLTEAELDALLEEVFVTNGQNCLRVCFGSSDYTYQTYQTYDDVSTDGSWSNFSIAMDEQCVIPILQKILQKNPGIWFVGAAWTPPAYLKTNKALCGGNFVSNDANNLAYANYYVLALQAYAARGIYFTQVSAQNEPQSITTVYPSCGWTAAALAAFYPVLRTQMDLAGFDNVGILAGDCNWGDVANYTSALTAGSQALASVDGVGLHGYDNNVVTAQPTMRLLGKDWYHTEWITFTNANDVTWLNTIAADLCVASVRAGAKALVMWNVFLDQNGAPVEEQILGTWQCRPLIAVQNDKSGTITRNLDYYLFAHLMRFVQRGARVMRSNSFAVGTPVGANNWQHKNVSATDVENVAFLNPDGTRIVFVLNPLTTSRTVTITDDQTGTSFTAKLAPQSAFTFVWGEEDIVETATTFVAPSAPTLGAPGHDFAGNVTVGITPPTTSGSTEIGAYRVYDAANPDAPLYVLPGTATSITDILLTGTASRTLYATAVGGGGESAASNSVTGTPLSGSSTYQITGYTQSGVGLATALTLTPNSTGPATATVVTLSDGGAGGTFSPATVTFAAGSATPQKVTYTPATAGSVTISGTNNGSLTNPAGFVMTVAAASATPTIVNLSASPTSLTVGGTLTATFTLDHPAINPVVITPQTLHSVGSFAQSSLTIAAGQTSASVAWTAPSTAQTVTMGCSNDSYLKNTSGVQIAVAATVTPPTKISLSGPSALTVGTASTYTFTLDQPATAAVVVTPACTLAGAWSTATLTIPVGGTSGTLTFNASAAGTGAISVTNGAGLTNPASLSVTATAAAVPFTTYGLSVSPATVQTGASATVSVTPGSGAANSADIVVTLSDGGAGGTFSPATVTFAAGSTTAASSTYTAGTTAGTVSISGTNNGSLTNPSAVSLTVSADAPAATSYLAATSSGAGATTTGTPKVLTGNVIECFVDCELDSYVNASVFSLLVGNYPTSGAAWNNSQFNLLIGTGGQVIVQYYDVNKVYCYSIASLPASLSGRVMFHSVANISTTDSYTDKLGNVIPASGIVIQVSQDGGKTYATCTAVKGHASAYGSINPGSSINPMSVGHLAENAGKIYSATVYDNTGTAVWSPDFTTQTAGATTFTDAESNAWAVDSGASITAS